MDSKAYQIKKGRQEIRFYSMLNASIHIRLHWIMMMRHHLIYVLFSCAVRSFIYVPNMFFVRFTMKFNLYEQFSSNIILSWSRSFALFSHLIRLPFYLHYLQIHGGLEYFVVNMVLSAHNNTIVNTHTTG